MGYSLFANRKILYTNMVFLLQSQLDNIAQQKQNLLNLSANIADGKLTVEEIANDPTNYQSYCDFLFGADEFKNLADDEGGASTSIGSIGSMAAEQNNSEAYLAAIAEMLDQKVSEEYAKQQCKKLEAQENMLDMQQKRIETRLSAAQQQLQAIEQAEQKEIEKSTPKYNGQLG